MQGIGSVHNSHIVKGFVNIYERDLYDSESHSNIEEGV